jgi:phosphatidylinositol glycan class K
MQYDENDYDIGVAVIDSYTHYVLQFMERINKTSQLTMQNLVRPCPWRRHTT